ncbi:hypothetical protein, unlikely [Trypanosoma congolense IL3000]|uniref:Uncharacterized protein n=1 Tax=Trypanosoma congolense (strain IL3000) TaxID=1068625 RepID=F9W7N2_TRYCI|nr:hypothetical protein, unlikely [Trypanosoma congolense IL3000]
MNEAICYMSCIVVRASSVKFVDLCAVWSSWVWRVPSHSHIFSAGTRLVALYSTGAPRGVPIYLPFVVQFVLGSFQLLLLHSYGLCFTFVSVNCFGPHSVRYYWKQF